MRILTGILYSDEAEFSQAESSLKCQRGVDIDSFVLAGLANKQAHDELYASFMSRASDFDYFFKFDADMTLRSPDSLKTLVDIVSRKGAAHALSYVFDMPSGLAIPGVQLFRSDSRWEGSDEQLNVDYPPRLFGESVLIVEPIFVNHMSAPSHYQLFRYGIHKALKAIQHGRGAKKSINKGLLHAAIINGMARNYFGGRSELVWALIGARLVFEGGVPGEGYHSEEVRSLFRRIESEPSLIQELSIAATQFFGNEVQNWFRWIGKFQVS
jgi:hypothetical protein